MDREWSGAEHDSRWCKMERRLAAVSNRRHLLKGPVT